jgi:hypothetical protein
LKTFTSSTLSTASSFSPELSTSGSSMSGEPFDRMASLRPPKPAKAPSTSGYMASSWYSPISASMRSAVSCRPSASQDQASASRVTVENGT